MEFRTVKAGEREDYKMLQPQSEPNNVKITLYLNPIELSFSPCPILWHKEISLLPHLFDLGKFLYDQDIKNYLYE